VNKVGWVLVRDGRLLVARNRGRDLFYLPGGRRELEEFDADTLSREAMEELGVQLLPTTMQLIADVTAPRDGAPGFVRMACYSAVSEQNRHYRLRGATPVERTNLSPADGQSGLGHSPTEAPRSAIAVRSRDPSPD